MSAAAIGALRRRIVVEAPQRIADDAASATVTWSAVATVWAAVEARAGREIVDADGLAARITHLIELRWRNDVTAAMRLRDGAAVYAIHAVHDADGRRRRLVCLAEELAP